MTLTAEKTKRLGYNLWYQLWKHPECEYKNDLIQIGGEAESAYRAVEFFPECCIFCEYDAQQRIKNTTYRKTYGICDFCPLSDKDGQCCHGYFSKWSLATDKKERKIYAKAIVDLISQWKI